MTKNTARKTRLILITRDLDGRALAKDILIFLFFSRHKSSVEIFQTYMSIVGIYTNGSVISLVMMKN